MVPTSENIVDIEEVNECTGLATAALACSNSDLFLFN